jgi:membrane-bound ClpP family serine protease
MTSTTREKFASQAAPDVLAAMRDIAATQGRQFQAVLDEAMRDYIERQQQAAPRKHVLAAFADSIEEFDRLYAALAK